MYIYHMPGKIFWEILRDTNKYVVLKNLKKEQERLGYVMHGNMTIKNFLFLVSLCVFLYISKMENGFLKTETCSDK